MQNEKTEYRLGNFRVYIDEKCYIVTEKVYFTLILRTSFSI